MVSFSAYFLAIILDLMTRLPLPYLSSVEQMARPLSSLAGKLGQTGLMGPIAVAAYSYMALVPIIQPPIMKNCLQPRKRACNQDGEPSSGIKAGEDFISYRSYNRGMSDPSYNGSIGWYVNGR